MVISILSDLNDRKVHFTIVIFYFTHEAWQISDHIFAGVLNVNCAVLIRFDAIQLWIYRFIKQNDTALMDYHQYILGVKGEKGVATGSLSSFGDHQVGILSGSYFAAV